MMWVMKLSCFIVVLAYSRQGRIHSSGPALDLGAVGTQILMSISFMLEEKEVLWKK